MEDKMVLPKQFKVLVAEDSLINRKLLELQFQQKNIDADFVENGLEVIGKITAGYTYHLLLLDIEMPEMNGYETATQLRTVFNNKMPIIAMSGYSDIQEKDKCLALGMNNYVSKPINMDILYAMMNELTQVKYAIESSESVVEEKEFDYIDLTYFRTMSGGRPEFELNIFQMFIEDIPIQLQEMIDAIKSSDYKLAAQIIHKMKSSLLMIGLHQIQPLIVTMEQELINGELNSNFSQQLLMVQESILAAIEELKLVVEKIKKTNS